MRPDSAPTLVDRIYEAALMPDRWPSVLKTISRETDRIGGMLFVKSSSAIVRWTACEHAAVILEDWIKEGWAEKNSRPARMFAKNHPGWVRESDIYTQEELEQEEDYRGFYKPRGLGHAAGMGIFLPSGDIGVFDVQRKRSSGPLTVGDLAFLDGLRPHLGRSALMAARLELDRARSTVGMLETLGLPAAILGENGKVLAANRLLETVHDQVVIGPFDRLIFKCDRLDKIYTDAIRRMQEPDPVGRGMSFPIRETERAAPAICHLLPIRGSARDIFTRASALLVVTALKDGAAPNGDILSGLFDLTPAEARVARGIAMGQTLAAIAARGGVSLATIRTQLKAVMGKTGTARQAELAALLVSGCLPIDRKTS